jgi:hypothetical protein
MGRRRAAFPEGIAEEEQRYAQALREIRDLRGETQQALGQLLGWSVRWCLGLKLRLSGLIRRRTGGTARWPLPRSCASGRWQPTRPCRRHQRGMPYQSGGRSRSGKVAPWTVLGSTSSSRRHTLPAQVLRLFGDESKPLPVWTEPAPSEQWTDVEAPLGALDLSNPPPDPRRWRYWERCDPRGERDFERHLDDWDRELVRSAPASERIWTPGTSSPMTWLT